MYKKDPVKTNLSLILDLSMNIPGSLPTFLDSKSISFAFALGLFAIK
jgi:hypothetical protein